MQSKVDYKPDLHYGNMLENDHFVSLRFKTYLDLLKPYLQKGVKVLDIGGYQGDLKLFLPEEIKYYVLDFDDQALAEAKRRGAKIRKINFDEEKIEWPKEAPFDIVVVTEVLEHLKDPIRHLTEIKKILKKGGVVLISLPNENMLYHRFLALFGFGIDLCAFQLYKHLHLPTITQSRNFLEKEFDIKREDYYINVSAQRSRFEFLGKFLTILPDWLWEFMAHHWPSGLARGVIFLLKSK